MHDDEFPKVQLFPVETTVATVVALVVVFVAAVVFVWQLIDNKTAAIKKNLRIDLAIS